MIRLLLCYLGGCLIGWIAAMAVVMPIIFLTPINTEAASMLSFLLGMAGGAAGGLYTTFRWGEAS